MAANSINSKTRAKAPPVALGTMKIRRWFSVTLLAAGMRWASQRCQRGCRAANISADLPSRATNQGRHSQRRHLAQQPLHQSTAAMAGRVGLLTQAMADHRRQHRLDVFRNHIITPGEKR